MAAPRAPLCQAGEGGCRAPGQVRSLAGAGARRALGARLYPPLHAAAEGQSRERPGGAAAAPSPQAHRRTPEPGRQPSLPSLFCNRCGCRPTGYIKERSRPGRGDVQARRDAKGQRQPCPMRPGISTAAARVMAGPASLPLTSSSHSTLWGRGPSAAAGFPPYRSGGQPGGQRSSASRREGQDGTAVSASSSSCLPPSPCAVQPSNGTFPTGAAWKKPCHRRHGFCGMRGTWALLICVMCSSVLLQHGAGQNWRRNSLSLLKTGLRAEHTRAVLIAPLFER